MNLSHLSSQIRHSELSSSNTLHVIGVIANPVRYHSRYRLFKIWLDEMLRTPNVRVHVVEAVYGDRKAECAPQAGQDYSYHAVRVHSEIWLKENLINIAVRNLLPKDWKYMAWVDCDVSFLNNDWALSTIHQLQHYNIVQPWSDVSDLDFYGEVIGQWKSFGSLHAKRKHKWHGKGKAGYEYAHTGFAWACTRYFYENVEKLLDFCVFGSADHHMAWACIGMIEETIHGGVPKDYLQACLTWEQKAKYACGGMVGFVSGQIRHGHHGPKTRRQYWGRWDIPLKNKFNPLTDLAYDSQGVLVLCGKNRLALEQDMMLYNRSRNEDSIEQY